MAINILKKFTLFILFTLLGIFIAPFGVSADDYRGDTYWYRTNVHVYVHKDLDASSTRVRLQSELCTPGQSVGQTATCPSVGYFVYQIGSSSATPSGTKTGPTASFPYAVYKTSISRSATKQLPDEDWWTIRASGLDGPTSTINYRVSKIMNNTVVTFKADGTTSVTAPTSPPGGDPLLTPLPAYTGDSSDSAGTTKDEPLTVGFSGDGIDGVSIDDTRCPEGSTTYTSGVLKDVPCDGALKTLDGALILVKNVVMIFLLPLVGTLFLIMLIIGGILYITSGGNPQQLERAKKTLTAAIIGLLIITLSYTIIAIFTRVIGGGTI